MVYQHTFLLAKAFCLGVLIEAVQVGCLYNTASFFASGSLFIRDDFAPICIDKLT